MAASVPYVVLNSGARMPILGLGTWLVNDDVTMRSALDLGYRAFDTAYSYRNEDILGTVLQEYFESGNLKREDVFITSKISLIHLKEEFVRDAFFVSLNALKQDYIDLMLFHTPWALKNRGDDDTFPLTEDGKMLKDHYDHLESWKVLENLVDEGRVKSIGVSNFAQEQLENLYDNARIKPSVNQIECHPYLPHTSFLEYCKSKNIYITASSCLGCPALPRLYLTADSEEVLLEDPILKDIGTKFDKSSAQIALRWQTQRGVIVIPKAVKPGHLKDNIDIFDIELSDDDMHKIDNITTRIQYVTVKKFGAHSHQDFMPYKMD